MPTHKTHLFVGFLTYILVLYGVLFLGPLALERKIELLIYTLIGSLFPDIDTKSKIQRIIYCMVFILMLMLFYLKHYVTGTIVGIVSCLPLMVHHRTLFHSRYFLVFLGMSVVVYTGLFHATYTYRILYNTIFFLAGVTSHLWADGLKKF